MLLFNIAEQPLSVYYSKTHLYVLNQLEITL